MKRVFGLLLVLSSIARADVLPEAVVISDGAPLANAPRVRVDIASAGPPQEVRLYRGSALGPFAEPMRTWFGGFVTCTTPCSVSVPPGALGISAMGERVAGTLVAIDVPTTGVAVTLKAPSMNRRVAGVGLLALAVPTAIVGVPLLTMAYHEHRYDAQAGRVVTAPNRGMVAAGAALVGTGGAMLAVSIALLASNRGGIASERALALAQGKIVF